MFLLANPDETDIRAACRQAFLRADTDKSGSLSHREFTRLVRQLTGRAATKRMLTKLLRMVDSDQSGVVTLEEFVKFTAPVTGIDEAEYDADVDGDAPPGVRKSGGRAVHVDGGEEKGIRRQNSHRDEFACTVRSMSLPTHNSWPLTRCLHPVPPPCPRTRTTRTRDVRHTSCAPPVRVAGAETAPPGREAEDGEGFDAADATPGRGDWRGG